MGELAPKAGRFFDLLYASMRPWSWVVNWSLATEVLRRALQLPIDVCACSATIWFCYYASPTPIFVQTHYCGMGKDAVSRFV